MTLFARTLSALLIVLTLLPLNKSDYWIFRIFDYPRLQKLFLSLVCIGLLAYCFDSSDSLCWVFAAAMVLNAVYLFVLVFPYTFFGTKQVLRVDNNNTQQSLSLMITNVYQDNKNYKGCLNEIEKADPDIVLLLEADKVWQQQLALDKMYKYNVTVPEDNTYGMLLYSKLELLESEIKFLVEDQIPSIHTKVVLPNGKQVQLYAVHPTPPVPNENPRATERDKELLLVADLAKASKLPVIVAGDLNDVAWSHTTTLFLKMSGLLDPRRGRGFYNSFNAHYPFLRFPLDHAFISPDFKLKEMRRLNNFNSDHFPIYLSLQYEPAAEQEQEPLEPAKEDILEAQEKKQKVTH